MVAVYFASATHVFNLHGPCIQSTLLWYTLVTPSPMLRTCITCYGGSVFGISYAGTVCWWCMYSIYMAPIYPGHPLPRCFIPCNLLWWQCIWHQLRMYGLLMGHVFNLHGSLRPTLQTILDAVLTLMDYLSLAKRFIQGETKQVSSFSLSPCPYGDLDRVVKVRKSTFA